MEGVLFKEYLKEPHEEFSDEEEDSEDEEVPQSTKPTKFVRYMMVQLLFCYFFLILFIFEPNLNGAANSLFRSFVKEKTFIGGSKVVKEDKLLGMYSALKDREYKPRPSTNRYFNHFEIKCFTGNKGPQKRGV